MNVVNIHEARTHLSRLVEQAAKGEPFIIAKAGRPMVKVVPIEADDGAGHSLFGSMAGEFSVPDDFNAMGAAEIERMFHGEE